MSELGEYEIRIQTAFARIDAASQHLISIEPKPAGGADDGDMSILKARISSLETEKLALSQQLRAAQSHKEATISEDEIDDLKGEIDQAFRREKAALAEVDDAKSKHHHELARINSSLRNLQIANADLSNANAQLRKSSQSGVTDATLINRTMQAELDAKTEQLHSYQTQVSSLLAQLEPLLETRNASN